MKIIFYDGFQQPEGASIVSLPYKPSLHLRVFKLSTFLHSVLAFDSLTICKYKFVLNLKLGKSSSVLDTYLYHETWSNCSEVFCLDCANSFFICTN